MMIKKRLIDNNTVRMKLNQFSFDCPVCRIPGTDKSIIAFDSMGNTDLIKWISWALTSQFPLLNIETIICPEAKAIPIAQELAKMFGIHYFTLRKSNKLYMKDSRFVEVESITTKGVQKLWFDNEEAKKLKGRRAIIFDDVVSTGSTFDALEKFANTYNLEIVSKLTVFLEGDAINRKDINALGTIPILTDEFIEKNRGEEF